MRLSRNPAVWVLASLVAFAGCSDRHAPVGIEIDATGPTPPRMQPSSMMVEGYPTRGEVRLGFIYDRAGNPLEILYEIHDGLAIWEGDIVLGTPDEIPSTRAELVAGEWLANAVVVSDNSKRWPGGVIPYTIDDATPSIVTTAIRMVEDETPGVTLVPRTDEDDYVTFRDASGCSSAIGMSGGQQFINLKVFDDDGGCSAGNAAHEILHALGLFHEHTRCDRDDFVIIDYDEIEDGREGNFYKAGSGSEDGDCSGAFDDGAYDPGSMMHYPTDAFAIGSDPTIIGRAGVDESVMGQRGSVGPTDVGTIDVLYGSNNAAPTASIAPLAASYAEGSSVPFDASGSTDADDDDSILTFAWGFGDGTCTGGAPPSTCSAPSPDHPYADDGEYSVEVTVSDGFDPGQAALSVTVTNVAPTVSAGSDFSVDEGSQFSRGGSFTDPGADTWTAQVDYDDETGTQVLPLVAKSFTLQHTYLDNGLSTILVTVTDDDGGVGTDEVDVTVDNVAPMVNAGPDAVVESGELFDFSGSFSDPGVEDDPWAWAIEWGVGTDSTGVTDDQSAPIESSSRYCAAGDYTVTLTVTDKDSDSGSDDLTVSVPYIAVAIDILPGTARNPVNLKQGGTIPVVILGSAELDVADIDPSSLTLGDETDPDTPIYQKNNGTFGAYMEDVNSDGFMDLTTMFPIAMLTSNGDLTQFSTELVLRGFLADACTNIRGIDVVDPLHN